MATLKEVAKEVGVSVATVSYVLNATGSVSKKVQDRVHSAVKKLNYKPNRKAQAMRTGLTKSIGLILPDLTNPFFPELAQKIELEARQYGYTVVLFNTQNEIKTELDGFNVLEQHGVDGIVWCPVTDNPSKDIREMKCPIVVVDRPIPGFDVVQSDYRQGGALLADYVNKSGHLDIGLLSGPQNIASSRQRRQGFLENLSKAAKIAWDIEVPFDINLSGEAIELLKTKKASLIVCGDDLIAIGAINILDTLSMNVPKDISVLGFDNIPWSRIIKPKLTTINQPVDAIGKEVVSLLLQRIKKIETTVKTIVLGVNLIERDSVFIKNNKYFKDL